MGARRHPCHGASPGVPEGDSSCPKLIVTASVNDVEEWLKFKARMVPAMAAVASDGSSYVAMDGSNRVASTWDVPDMGAFQAAQSSFSGDLAAGGGSEPG